MKFPFYGWLYLMSDWYLNRDIRQLRHLCKCLRHAYIDKNINMAQFKKLFGELEMQNLRQWWCAVFITGITAFQPPKMEQTITTNASQMADVSQTAPIDTNTRYINVTREVAEMLGLGHLVIGMLCIIFQIVSIAVATSTSLFGAPGIWTGSLVKKYRHSWNWKFTGVNTYNYVQFRMH